MKPKVYIETTIPSYLTGRPSRDLVIVGHQELTREWWDERRDAFDLSFPSLYWTRPEREMSEWRRNVSKLWMALKR